MTYDERLMERYELAAERVREIASEAAESPYRSFFVEEARWLSDCDDLRTRIRAGWLETAAPAEKAEQIKKSYEDILPENYGTSYGNPDYAQSLFGRDYGGLLSFLYTELRGAVVFAYEDRLWDMTLALELLLEIYGMFEEEVLPEPGLVRESLYWYVSDYCGEMVERRIREMLSPEADFAVRVIMESDLSNEDYLYSFGEYITENEIGMARFLAGLSEEEIQAIARTWTEGYRMGFEVQRKELSIKQTVNIRYRLGFERVVRAAVSQFEAMGLKSVIYRSAVHAVDKNQHIRGGYYGAVANPQFDYDHRNDAALFLDERFVSRKLEALREGYEKLADLARGHAGPAVLEVFGETPFLPEAKETAWSLSKDQQVLKARYSNEAGQITNRFIPGEERSFTIIAYPVPEIGESFEDIFRETIRLNNLDYQKYQRIQQKMIDALDEGESVRILGAGDNQTDLTVRLHHLEDPKNQTNFENCVADVNIPVGEVFTSPLLEGTSGILHVSRVYLGDLAYRGLKIVLEDGMVRDYTCENFDSEEENRRFIKENLLFHHDSLPLGEFAIGTNTTAYRMARDFGIEDKLPILIAEKMGPHFALGDTCYSWQEDVAVFNPDGKEIIARDNECSLKRKNAPSEAYFGCHTDITIPYEELACVSVVGRDGSRRDIIRDGRFVLEGCEDLNLPLNIE